MHHILFYDYVQDIAERRGPHREGHLAHIRSEPKMLIAGAVGDPLHGGVLIFKDATPEEIERFAAEDPYTRAGLVQAHRIEPWNVVHPPE